MKKILEAILVINLAVLSCIVFINTVLRYGFQTSTLSIDELLRYLFVWSTLIGAIVTFMDSAHTQITFLMEKLSPAWQRRVALVTHSLILFICGAPARDATLKTIQDWSDYPLIFDLSVDLTYVACLPTNPVITLFESCHLHQFITRSNSPMPSPQGA